MYTAQNAITFIDIINQDPNRPDIVTLRKTNALCCIFLQML